MASDHLDVMLLGKEYRVACTPEARDELLATVAYLDDKLSDLGGRTNAGGEKLAIMTALNIAHEFLQYQRGGGFDIPGVKRRIGLMNARLDGVLSKAEKLF
ncbi:MAG: cell division protein ZapA [Thauera sp.]|nr:cell division protein ZapA [Thauera sp.]